MPNRTRIREGGAPLYETLYRRLRADILTGRLTAGERLPSSRALAEEMGVSRVTAETAYAQLTAEGYVRSVARSGRFVEPVGQSERLSAPRPAGEPAAPQPLIDCARIASTPVCFPFSTWARIMRRVILDDSAALLHGSPYNGFYSLRQAIAGYLYRAREMEADPDCIVVGAGSEYLSQLLVQLLGRETCFGVENPGYRQVARILEAGGVEYVNVEGDGNGPVLSALRRSAAEALFLSPAHQFPTGAVMPVRRRQELLHWAAEAPGRYLVEDDYDSEFRPSGRPFPTLQSADPDGRVIYMNTLSGTLAPSLRISYMVLPPPLMARFREKLSFYSCTVPGFEQLTLERFLREGYFERHLNRARKYYRSRLAELTEVLRASPFASRLTMQGEGTGLHFLLRVDTALTDEALTARLAAVGIRAAALGQYYAPGTAPGETHRLVVNYSSLRPEDMETVAAALRALQETAGSPRERSGQNEDL